jgi:hypothetical protein
MGESAARLGEARAALGAGDHGASRAAASAVAGDAGASESERVAAARLLSATALDPVALSAGAAMLALTLGLVAWVVSAAR